MATKTRLRIRSLSSSDAFTTITTLKSDTSGEHWVTPFGIPATEGTVSAARAGKLFARKTGTTSPVFPVGVDNVKSWGADSSMRHIAGHVKLPSDYVAEEKYDIGYSDTETVPSAPNWSTVTSTYAATFNATVSIYSPKVVLAYLRGYPKIGDSMSVTIADGRGGDLTYTQDLDSILFGLDDNLRISLALSMMRRISFDASGRYESVKNHAGKLNDMTAANDPILRNSTTLDSIPGYSQETVKMTSNAATNLGIGMWSYNSSSAPFAPEGWSPGEAKAGGVFMIFPRYYSGNPENYTATFVINQDGRTIGYDTTTTEPEGGKLLNWDAQTAAFSNATGWVKGRTSGTVARYLKVKDNGTTGWLVVQQIGSPGFSDNEIIDAFINSVATAASGSATVNGAVVQNKIRNGSGVVADLLDKIGFSTLCIRNVTGGSFADNDVCTSDDGGAFTINGTISAASGLVMTMSSGDTTGATSGTIPQIHAPANRSSVAIGFATGTDLENHGDFFNNTQTRQKIRRVAINSHLDAYMVVTWDKDGAVVDRQLIVDNAKTRADSKEYWYDVTSINDGTTNFIASDLADYQCLMHTVFAKWRWRQDKAFGMCDPMSFMKSGLIWTWERFPNDDARAFLYNKTQGLDASGDLAQVFNQTLYDARGGYSKSRPNIPLFAGPIKFDTEGGAAIEIGVYTAWERAFWAYDSLLMWEQFEALCDNCWSAWPFYMRDENGSADWEYAAPHPYLRWYWNSESSSAAPSDQKIKVGQTFRASNFAVLGGSAGSGMWTGHSIGGYKAGRTPAKSHAPPHPARSAYLARPEWCFLDSLEQYTFAHGAAFNDETSGKSAPKTAGVAGDVDHVMAATASNGNRDWSWPARDYTMLAGTLYDAHPRKAIWVRATTDMANHFDQNISNTWYGFFNGRGPRDSNNWTSVPQMKTGDAYRKDSTGLVSALPCSPFIDLFKSSYCTMVAVLMKELGVVDTGTMLDKQNGWLRMIEDVTDADPTKWWYWVAPTGLQVCPIDGFGDDPDGHAGYASSTTGIVRSEDFNELRVEIDALDFEVDLATTQAQIKNPNWMRTMNYVTSPFKWLNESGFYYEGIGDSVYSTNYTRYRFYVTCWQGLARSMADSSKRARAQAIVDLVDGYLPYDEVLTTNASGLGSGVTYTDAWGVWAARQPAEINTYW